MNIFQYAANEEMVFERMVEECGYTRKTTFYSDLSIAEWYGNEAIEETYNNVLESWGTDKVYFTEFVLSLNWKSWEWYERQDEERSRLYSELYYRACDWIAENWDEEKREYFYAITD